MPSPQIDTLTADRAVRTGVGTKEFKGLTIHNHILQEASITLRGHVVL